MIPDIQPVDEHLTNVLPLVRDYGISAYDAAYLELSLRHSAPLATLEPEVADFCAKELAQSFTQAFQVRPASGLSQSNYYDGSASLPRALHG